MADPKSIIARSKQIRASYDPESQMAKLNERLMELMVEILRLVKTSVVQETSAQLKSEPSETQVVEGRNVPTVDAMKDQGPHAAPLAVALESLAAATTTRDEGGRQFLLHRVTADHEYAQGHRADENTFSTAFATEWLADAQVAEKTRTSNNPLISAWIPESAIESIPGSESPDTATHAGQKPQTGRFVVQVKPGKYTIYSERKS